jgi:serine protease
LKVVSVGAFTTPTERAPYSNFGPWVQEWRRGTSLVSTMPLTTSGIGKTQLTDRATAVLFDVDEGSGYAWWSGTSFAAALYAAELARQMPAG